MPRLIPPGYVGVVTNRTDNPLLGETQGIQDNVLQPGIYFINPVEKRVDIISIGFNETTQMVETRDGSSTANRGLDWLIDLAKTAGEGPGLRTPRQRGLSSRPERRLPDPPGLHGDLGHPARPGARRRPPVRHPEGSRTEGDLAADRLDLPAPRLQADLSVRPAGLKEDDTREEFQTDTSEELERVLDAKNLTLLFGLTRHIYVPNQVREPIQKRADRRRVDQDSRARAAHRQGPGRSSPRLGRPRSSRSKTGPRRRRRKMGSP